MIPKFDVSEFINEKKEINLGELLQSLKDINFPIEGNMIYYFSPEAEMYLYCGYDPISEDILIPKEDYLDVG